MPSFDVFQEREGCLLNFRTPVLELFSETGKKALYITCVKVSHMNSLKGLKESNCRRFSGQRLPLKVVEDLVQASH